MIISAKQYFSQEYEFSNPIVDHFVEHLNSDYEMDLLLEGLPKSDFVAAVRKIGVEKAKKLELNSTTDFENHIKKGFKEATTEITTLPEKELAVKLKVATNIFRDFLHLRTLEAQSSVKNEDDFQHVHKKGNKTEFVGGNYKTKLSSSQGVLTVGLSLPPFTTAYNKFNVCTTATPECKSSCLGLYAGGAKSYPDTAFLGKLLRLQFMVEYPKETALVIHKELQNHYKNSSQKGFLAGFRANITSDIDFIRLFPKEFFEANSGVQFYDYTKDASRLEDKRIDPLTGEVVTTPKNYYLSLSHTGTNHSYSNDADAVKALNADKVVTMVVYPGKGLTRQTPQVFGVIDDATDTVYQVTYGDNDDNIFDRHAQAKINPQDHSALDKDKYKFSSKGVVSIVKLKGTTKEKAGNFANLISPDGYVHINSKQKLIPPVKRK